MSVTNYQINGKCSRCGQCCGAYLPLSRLEAAKMEYLYKSSRRIRDRVDMLYNEDKIFSDSFNVKDIDNLYMTCPFFDYIDKKCLIYDNRPKVCLLFHCDEEEMIDEIKELNEICYYNSSKSKSSYTTYWFLDKSKFDMAIPLLNLFNSLYSFLESSILEFKESNNKEYSAADIKLRIDNAIDYTYRNSGILRIDGYFGGNYLPNSEIVLVLKFFTKVILGRKEESNDEIFNRLLSEIVDFNYDMYSDDEKKVTLRSTYLSLFIWSMMISRIYVNTSTGDLFSQLIMQTRFFRDIVFNDLVKFGYLLNNMDIV